MIQRESNGDASAPGSGAVRVGPWTIDPRARTVTGPSGTARLEPKAMAVLMQLASRPAEVVDRQTLLEAGWGTAMATDDVLSRAISELRRALGDDPRRPRIVETVRGTGYRLLVPEGRERRERSEARDLPAAAGAPTIPAARATGGSRRRARLTMPVATLLLVAAAGAVAVAWSRRTLAVAAGAGPTSPVLVPLTTLPGEESGPSVSPDGTRIAYAWLDELGAEQQIHVKVAGSASDLRITSGRARHQSPAWSPDGTRIAFVRSDSAGWAIAEAPSLGGTPRLVMRAPAPMILGLDWSPDGRWLAFAAHDSSLAPFGIRLLAPDDDAARERRLTDGGGAAFGDVYPTFSPDGGTLAFVRFFNEVAADVFVVPVAGGGGAPRRLTFDERSIGALEFSADGDAVLFGASRHGRSAVWRVGLDRPGVVTEVAAVPGAVTGIAAARGSDALVVAAAERDLNLWRVAPDGAPPPARAISSTRSDALPRHSPDGARVAFVSDRTGSAEVWLADDSGGAPVRITDVGGVASAPAWSPDGSRVAFERRADGESTLWIADVGRRTSRRVAMPLRDAVAPSWSRDGRWLYVSARAARGWEVWRVPVAGGSAEQVTRTGGLGGRETPDGGALLHTKPSADGLWRLDLRTGRETLLAPGPVAGDWTNWDAGRDGVHLVRRDPTGRQDLVFQPYGGAPPTTVVSGVRIPSAIGGLSLSPDGRSLLYAQFDRRDGDLHGVEAPGRR